MTSNHNKQEPSEFDKALSDALFNQYQLGREHQRVADTGKKRKVGGEITDAKQAIKAAIAEHIIGKDELVDRDEYQTTVGNVRSQASNELRKSQRNALYGEDKS